MDFSGISAARRYVFGSRLVFLCWALCACVSALAQTAPAPPAPVVAPEVQDARKLYRRGELGPALERLEKYLQAKPDDLNGRFLRGVILADQARVPDAIDAFTRITQDYPELPEAHNNLAVLYAGQGRYDRARLALEQALLANPADATAQENLGDVYIRLASQAYERAAGLAPANRSARAKLTLLRELSNARSQARDLNNTIESRETK